MNTKEGIEFLEAEKSHYPSHDVQVIMRYDKIIDLLKSGGKYEKMWKAFKKKYRYYPMAKINKEGLLECTTDNMLVGFNMDEFEQEYFPEPIKKTINIEIEADNEGIINDQFQMLATQLFRNRQGKKSRQSFGYMIKFKEGD